MRLFKRRAPREGVSQAGRYPQPFSEVLHPRATWWYRFLLGRPMDGIRWGNGTFWRDATSGEDHTWLRLAGWKRAAVRLLAGPALLWSIAVSIAALLQQWDVLLLLLQWAIVLVAPPVVLRDVLRALRRHGLVLPVLQRVTDAESLERSWRWSTVRVLEGVEHWRRTKVAPVAQTLAVRTGAVIHQADAHHYVTVPRDYADGGQVEVRLPRAALAMNETARRTLAKALGERLGIEQNMEHRYELELEQPRLLLSATVLPPDFVSFTDLLHALEQADTVEHRFVKFVVGKAGAEVLSVNLQSDSPHLALSAGSGGGKSEFIKQVIAQWLHWGGFVIIMDWKEGSQAWAEGLPGVRYIKQPEALHDMCVAIGEEVEYRKANPHAERIPLLVISEEWNVTSPVLSEYWFNYRAGLDLEERRTTPTKSPAHGALMKLNFTGRALGMHQFLVAQRFSARVTNGNADLRESFTTIFLTRWKGATWKMLTDIKPIPKKLTKPGQWMAVTGDEMVRFQAGLWADDEAREWSMSGQPNPASPWVLRGAPRPPVQASTQEDQLGLALTVPSVVPTLIDNAIEAEIVPDRAMRKLRDLVDAVDHFGITLNILQMAAKGNAKYPNFPDVAGGDQFSGYLYYRDEVVEWARKLRAGQAAEAAGKAMRK